MKPCFDGLGPQLEQGGRLSTTLGGQGTQKGEAGASPHMC
jgi:hypothetical protein